MPRVWVAMSIGGAGTWAAVVVVVVVSGMLGKFVVMVVEESLVIWMEPEDEIVDAVRLMFSTDPLAERSSRMLFRDTRSGRRSRSFSDSSSAQGLMLGLCGSTAIAKYDDAGSCFGGDGVRRAVLGREESRSSLSPSAASERERLREVVERFVSRGGRVGRRFHVELVEGGSGAANAIGCGGCVIEG